MAPIFLQLTKDMLCGSAVPPDDFNWAFLVCLPKGSGSVQFDGNNAYDAQDTRPLSIVDAANWILASIFRVSLERVLGSWVSEFQRGFLRGRQMLRNVIDVDFAAQKISVRSTSGAILLFDFAAAFPSMSHDFMWDVLSYIGIPESYINMLKLFYKRNLHFMSAVACAKGVFCRRFCSPCVRMFCYGSWIPTLGATKSCVHSQTTLLWWLKTTRALCQDSVLFS